MGRLVKVTMEFEDKNFNGKKSCESNNRREKMKATIKQKKIIKV